MTDAAALAATRHWLERVVIGLELCPFAAAPYRAQRILYATCGGDTEAIYAAFLRTLEDLLVGDARDMETALLIVTAGLERFDGYLDMLEMLEQAVVSASLQGQVQLASFHPDYRFAGAAASDPANYSNRSPYPMFHLIRADRLAELLRDYAAPEAIPARNIERLRRLGVEGLERLLAAQ